jgi:hypothetical protein
MARRDDNEEAVNADSFLDIVASVVSVLIIMVMMTGLRIKHTPVDAPLTGTAAQIAGDLKREQGVEHMLKDEVMKIAATTEETKREAARREQERDALLLAVTKLQQAAAAQAATSQALAQTGPAGRELQEKIFAAQTKLDMLRQQTVAVQNAPPVVEKVENYPSPIGRTVDGREIHFQLHHGRLAFVPLNELVEVAMADAKRRIATLRDKGQLENTVPPQDGFRMTYTLKLHEITADESRETGRHGMQVEDRVVLTPVSDDIGEPVDVALGPQSQFRGMLAERSAREATITLWIYPDSFDQFRKVKKELYRLGFPVAVRPLPEGVPISGSSQGSKSTAE